MAGWLVTEPDANLWLADIPYFYNTSRGKPLRFKLFFKNQHDSRNALENSEPKIFSVGTHWHTPWRSYLEPVSGESTNFWVYLGYGTAQKTTLDTIDYLTQSKLTQVSTTNVLQFRDGAQNIYGLTTTVGGVTRYFLTSSQDPQGNTMQFQYVTNGDSLRLDKIIDVDNRSTTFEYSAGANYSNLITKVIGPHSLTNTLKYDSSDRLTNITDVIGISSRMQYDSSTNLTALITPYGTNKFSYFSIVSRMTAVQVTELDVRKHLFLYYASVDGGKVPSDYNSYRPTTTNGSYFAIPNTLDASNSDLRNSFYWNPRQYEQLSDLLRTNLNNGSFNVSNLSSSDYLKARQKHWLLQPGSTNIGFTISLQRDASPDGTLQGQIQWFDYVNKNGGNADQEGTLFAPRFSATKLPNGECRFKYYERNNLGNPTNRVETYTDAGATCRVRTNQYSYAANNIDLVRQVQLLGSASRQVMSNVFNSAHQVVTNYDAVTNMTRYSFDSNQKLVTTVTPSLLTRSNVYNTSGTWSNFLSQTVEVEINRTSSFSYSNGYVSSMTDPRNMTMTYTRDALGRITQTSFPDSSTQTHSYSNLDLIKVVDRMSCTNKYVYDGFRQRTLIIDPRGGSNSFSFCSCGVMDSTTDPSGKTTSFSYDSQGQRTVVTYPSGGSVTNNFNLLHQLTSVIDSAGASVTNWFINQGLVYAVSNGFGGQQMFTHDMEGQRTNVIDANSVTNSYIYDPLGRTTMRTDPNNQSETFTYSSNGLSAYTNQLRQWIRYQYDAAGRKTAETNANGEVVLYAYNAAGDLLSLTDGKGQKTSWGYDPYGRATSKTNADGTEVLRYQYDANGRLTNRWSLAKGNTAYKYDSAGNLTNIVYPSSTAIVMQYDANNRLISMVDAAGTTSFSYTDFGALLSEDGPWANDTITYSYTTNRLRSKFSLLQPNASAWEQSYGYDSANRLTTVTSPAGTFGYLYDASSHLQVADLSLPNGAYITNTYDALNRETGTYLKNSGGATLNSHTYTYDNAGRRTRQIRTGGDYDDYTYDSIGQLQAAIGKESDGTTNRMHEQFGYSYDAANNLSYRTNDALIQPFSVDNLNQLTTITRSGNQTVAGTTWSPATNVTVADNGNAAVAASRYADNTFARTNVPLVNGTNTFTAVARDNYGRVDTNIAILNLPTTVNFAYDGNGNLNTNGARFLQYDDENQLTRITEPNAWKSEFTYDGKMRRRIRKEYTWQSGIWNLQSEIRYVYDGNLVIQERDANNLPVVGYTRGKDLSGSLEGAGGIGGLLAFSDLKSSISNPSHYFYHADGNGNVTMLISSLQLTVAKYLYDPFGNTLSSSGPLADVNLYRFSSKEAHPSSGVVYYLYRYYDASLQRWPNRDPIGEPGFEVVRNRKEALLAEESNRYRFVNNNPLGYNDPFGLQSLPPGWHGPGCPYDPSSNPFPLTCGGPGCSQTVCRACCAAAGAGAALGCRAAGGIVGATCLIIVAIATSLCNSDCGTCPNP